jgi:anti-anti-sigma factor
MVLNTTTSKIDGFIVVYLSGDIFFGEESASPRILVKNLLNKSRQIVLDLGNVTHIDSGSVGALVAVYASARKVGGDIKFANLGNHAKEVLQITKLGQCLRYSTKQKTRSRLSIGPQQQGNHRLSQPNYLVAREPDMSSNPTNWELARRCPRRSPMTNCW